MSDDLREEELRLARRLDRDCVDSGIHSGGASTMSNYRAKAFNPASLKIEDADFIDDYYGSHRYGVRFDDGSIHPQSMCGMKQAADLIERQYRIIAAHEQQVKDGAAVIAEKDAEIADALDALNAETARAIAAESSRDAAVEAEREACLSVLQRWVEVFGTTQIQYTSAREYACDAIQDCIDIVRSRAQTAREDGDGK